MRFMVHLRDFLCRGMNVKKECVYLPHIAVILAILVKSNQKI